MPDLHAVPTVPEAGSRPAPPEARVRTVLASAALVLLVQGMVGQFVFQGIPAFLRKAGHSPEVIGLIFLAGIPYILRFLWAPLVDRYGWPAFGHRRSWILPVQLLMVLAVGGLLFLDPADGARPIVVVAGLIMVLIGTQLVAIGAFLLENLPRASHPAAASVQGMAAAVAGFVLGGGVLYLVADRGWTATVTVLAGLCALGLLAVLLLPLDRGRGAAPSGLSPMASLTMLRRPEVRRLLLLLMLVETGLALPYGMKAIVQVDAGLTVAQIGLLGVVGGNTAGLLGAWTARPVVDRLGAGRTLFGIGLLTATLYAGLSVLAAGRPTPEVAAVFVLASNFLLFAHFTASRSLIMGVCDAARAGTELATFLCFCGALNLALASAGNSLSVWLGLPGLFLSAAGVAVVGAAAALWLTPPPWSPAR